MKLFSPKIKKEERFSICPGETHPFIIIEKISKKSIFRIHNSERVHYFEDEFGVGSYMKKYNIPLSEDVYEKFPEHHKELNIIKDILTEF